MQQITADIIELLNWGRKRSLVYPVTHHTIYTLYIIVVTVKTPTSNLFHRLSR